MINKIEEAFKQFYTSKNCRGLSTVFTPKIVRDSMTIHAKPEMKILVIFNFEFCYDLNKMGCRNVMFVSDDEVRNKVVEETWCYKTELVEPHDINKKLKEMKFDLIIGNPPYNKGLDLKILESVLELSDNICFVHPAGYLLDNSGYFDKTFNKNLIKNRLKLVELIDGNKLFNIGLFMPCAIIFLSKHEEEIHITDSSKHFFNDTKKWKEKNIFEIDKYGWHIGYKDILRKIKTETKNPFKKGETVTLGVASIRGHVASNDFYTIVQNDVNKHIHHKYEFGWDFKTNLEAENCFSYLKTKFARFCISVFKLHSNNAYFLNFIPWFDFTKPWTDEKCAAQLGITDEELLWMIQQIPDYYPEDAETYRKLEEKLNGKSN